MRRGGASPIIPILITAAVFLLAVASGWAMWRVYMEAPWTRDGTVRAYVVTMAPEVVGRIVELPVADNQFVHKGDLLMVIDPTDYRIAVKLAEAAVQQAQVDAENLERESKRRQELSNAGGDRGGATDLRGQRHRGQGKISTDHRLLWIRRE